MAKKLLQIPESLHNTLRLRSALSGRAQYLIVLDALAAYLDTDDGAEAAADEHGSDRAHQPLNA